VGQSGAKKTKTAQSGTKRDKVGNFCPNQGIPSWGIYPKLGTFVSIRDLSQSGHPLVGEFIPSWELLSQVVGFVPSRDFGSMFLSKKETSFNQMMHVFVKNGAGLGKLAA
jgi:hypothetical protein